MLGKKIGIIVDDHQLFADSFSKLLESTVFFSTINNFSGGEQLIQYLSKNPKKEICLFLDFYLKNETALSFINEIRRLNKSVSIVIVSSVTNSAALRMILLHRPDALISKSAGFDIILDSLQKLEKGKTYCCPFTKADLKNNHDEDAVNFSLREIEILQYFARGLSVIETSKELFLSKHTVVSHRRNMMKKTNTSTITDLLTFARRNELISE